MRRFPSLLALLPITAWAASPMSRLQGVSQHARAQAAGGPDHLWVGLGVGLAVVVVVALAAFWVLGRRKS